MHFHLFGAVSLTCVSISRNSPAKKLAERIEEEVSPVKILVLPENLVMEAHQLSSKQQPHRPANLVGKPS